MGQIKFTASTMERIQHNLECPIKISKRRFKKMQDFSIVWLCTLYIRLEIYNVTHPISQVQTSYHELHISPIMMWLGRKASSQIMNGRVLERLWFFHCISTQFKFFGLTDMWGKFMEILVTRTCVLTAPMGWTHKRLLHQLASIYRSRCSSETPQAEPACWSYAGEPNSIGWVSRLSGWLKTILVEGRAFPQFNCCWSLSSFCSSNSWHWSSRSSCICCNFFSALD